MLQTFRRQVEGTKFVFIMFPHLISEHRVAWRKWIMLAKGHSSGVGVGWASGGRQAWWRHSLPLSYIWYPQPNPQALNRGSLACLRWEKCQGLKYSGQNSCRSQACDVNPFWSDIWQNILSSPSTSTPYPHKYLGGKLILIWTNWSNVGDHLSQTQHCRRGWHPHFKENLAQPRDWNCPPPTHPVVVLWPSPCDISVQIRPRTSQSGWFSPKYGFVYNVGHLGHTDSHAVLIFSVTRRSRSDESHLLTY